MSTIEPLQPPIALTIAGSDSGGGAGIQADLRTFAFHRVHGASAITCVTAQNTTGVSRVDALPVDSILAQMDAVAIDMNVAAIKVGMLLNQPIIDTVASWLQQHSQIQIVVDPVMISRSGDPLIDKEAVKAMHSRLLPLSNILTPNIYEAQLLSDITIETLSEMETAARIIYALGPDAVVIKGGGLAGEMCGTDVWFDGKKFETLMTEHVDTSNTHGTGCTFSSAIAANLANGLEPLAATQAAKQYVTEALKHSLSIGKGNGPVGHFYPILDS
ncbi:MAG: bifunctional hydroxymethylpyrimidine kinase/phosphomethylpyrimidine kinase [Mariniblastus sp.]